MNTQIEIEIEGQKTAFTLNWEDLRWESPATLEEGQFPVITFIDGKRYELYSDGTFAQVEL